MITDHMTVFARPGEHQQITRFFTRYIRAPQSRPPAVNHLEHRCGGILMSASTIYSLVETASHTRSETEHSLAIQPPQRTLTVVDNNVRVLMDRAASHIADPRAQLVISSAAPHHRKAYAMAKRAFDVALASLLIVLVSPVLAIAAMLVHGTSEGPIFFKQTRIGKNGRAFRCLKFRTMVPNAHAMKIELVAFNEATGPVFKLKRDPRVTPVGRWLRKFSIDELPQLINVLRGEMSLVGPRPPLPDEVAHVH